MGDNGGLRINEVPVILIVVVQNFLSDLLGAFSHEILPVLYS